ncbi:hypothetical protein FXO38_33622 [Capsicum annuum]|uniref:CW-type domain-containing protein n=1 Tax=Capsicum annuum TaxID=4072 RepID=A0A2G2YY06_CAPAN|nr:hypothetical protein FXO38_33622 [Capsicum annuum]PHT74626.1 hypothetical protein T459_21903 [Capsicum annuum]
MGTHLPVEGVILRSNPYVLELRSQRRLRHLTCQLSVDEVAYLPVEGSHHSHLSTCQLRNSGLLDTVNSEQYRTQLVLSEPRLFLLNNPIVFELNAEVTTSSVGLPVSMRKKVVKRVASHKDEPPVSPFIIQGDWICCVNFHKWRLLPYGIKREQLSASWLCSMLDWLPGMNCCDISKEDTTRGLHAIFQSLILNNFQNRDGKGSIDVKAHNGKTISVKKRKLKDQDCLGISRCNGNDLGDDDANAVNRKVSSGFKKQEISKRESRISKGEEKSQTRDTVARIIPGIKDSPLIDGSAADREH